MNGVVPLLLAALAQIATVPAVQPSIDFHFTSDAVLERGLAAATTQWTAQCVADGEFAAVTGSYAPDPGMAVDERRAQMAKFDRNDFVRIATAAWQTANAALPQRPIRVCVDVARTSDTFTGDVMGGITAVTAGQGRLILRIHPGADWKTVLPYVLAHEMHHSYWLQQHYDRDRPFTLADYLVLEGRADYFARSLFAHPAPWTAPLDAADYVTLSRALAKDLNAVEWATLQAAMFGSPQAGIPMWAGYRLGYRLVSERMMRTPTLDLKAMTAASASEFTSPLESPSSR